MSIRTQTDSIKHFNLLNTSRTHIIHAELTIFLITKHHKLLESIRTHITIGLFLQLFEFEIPTDLF